jgi:AcrR family transcriptional regulator
MTEFIQPRFAKLPVERQNQVLNLLIDAFTVGGFQQFGINRFCKDAGISIGALYSYFSSKEDAFLASLTHSLSLLAQAVSQPDSYANLKREAIMLEIALSQEVIELSNRIQPCIQQILYPSLEKLGYFSDTYRHAEKLIVVYVFSQAVRKNCASLMHFVKTI